MYSVVGFVVFAGVLTLSGAQFENGFVKILEDQRYQEGAAFGNFRNQEDGIKYKEETDANNIRRGFWEYPDENGKLVRVEFEAGPGIGFRVVNSNIVPPTQTAGAKQPVAPLPAPIPVQRNVIAPLPTTSTTPGPINIFDYPADLKFFRDANGHRFQFSAL